MDLFRPNYLNLKSPIQLTIRNNMEKAGCHTFTSWEGNLPTGSWIFSVA